MTVRCLQPIDKNNIAIAYHLDDKSAEELAPLYDVSVRTIQRVLVERGVNRARARRAKGEGVTTQAVPQIKPTVLHIDMIELTFKEKVLCLFKAIFWRTNTQDNAQTRK